MALRLTNPAIYYGRSDFGPVIAPNDSGEMGHPVGDTTAEYNYQGTGGVPISNMFRKLVFALYFGERDIFFTTKTNRDSRMLFRRNIVEAIKTLTPFFTLDKDPYIVVYSQRTVLAPGRLYHVRPLSRFPAPRPGL